LLKVVSAKHGQLAAVSCLQFHWLITVSYYAGQLLPRPRVFQWREKSISKTQSRQINAL